VNYSDRQKLINENRLLQLEKEQWKRQCRSDLTSWCVEALSEKSFGPARHHRLLISYLEKVKSGQIDRLMVFMPPGSAKSTYCSELFPPYYMINNPYKAIIAASHTGELAERFGRKVRGIVDVKSEILGYALDPSNRAANRWETDNGCEYFAAGVGGAITGRRADLAVIDDPVKSRESAESETERLKTIEWYKSDLYTRLKPGAAIILIMTRWHIMDLGGYLLSEMEAGGDKWTVLSLPGLSRFPDDPLGRKIGEPLWGEWENKEAIERKRQTLGIRDFGAMYQQDPQPPGGSFFKLEDFLVDGLPVDPNKFTDTVFAIIDTAVKTGSKHDSTAVIYFQMNKRIGHPLIILEWDLVQIEGSLLELWIPQVFDKLERYAIELQARMGSAGVHIEDKNSGSILIQQCQRKFPNKAYPIDTDLTAKGKDERAISVSGYIVQQKVKFSVDAYNKVINYKGRNANHLVTQTTEFVIGIKDQPDDLLDCLCYGISIALGDSSGF
jgi:hypothetical protein